MRVCGCVVIQQSGNMFIQSKGQTQIHNLQTRSANKNKGAVSSQQTSFFGKSFIAIIFFWLPEPVILIVQYNLELTQI